MNGSAQDLESLQTLLQSYSVSFSVRVIAFVGAAALFATVFEAVRRRRLREDLTPIWLTAAFGILALGVSFDLLVWLTRVIGAWTPSSTVFFFGLLFLTAISLNYAIRLSDLSNQVKTLAQEIAILKAEGGVEEVSDADEED